MFKAMIMLTRPPDQTRESFAQWWTVDHAPLARQLPGLRRAVFNLATNEDSNVDGIAELWFDTQQDFEAAYATEIGKAVAQDSLDNVSGRTRYLIEEHPIFP